MRTAKEKPDLSYEWQVEVPSMSGEEQWAVLLQAGRINGEAIVGLGWVPMHAPHDPTSTVCFHRDAATALLRTLYSAFAALENPDDYLKQMGLYRLMKARPATSAIVGSARDHGCIQIHVDWSQPSRRSTFMIYPPKAPQIYVSLGIESVAQVTQIVIEAFKKLGWRVPR